MRAGDVLAKQAELSVESEVREILHARANKIELSVSKPDHLLGAFGDVLILEQAAGEPLMSEHKRGELVRFLASRPPLGEQKKTDLMLGHFNALDFGGWVQAFPDEKDLIRLDDDELAKTVRFLLTLDPVIVSKERLLLNLMQIRPDKQVELRGMLQSNIEELWKERGDLFQNWNWLHNFLGRLAAWEIIHPEAKEIFKLSPEEKKIITTFMRITSSIRGDLERFLRNACIVLAEEAVLQENGQIRIQMKKHQLAGRGPELPQRSAV